MSYLKSETFMDLPLVAIDHEFPAEYREFRGNSLVIGNFDGVHQGHKRLVHLAKNGVVNHQSTMAREERKNSCSPKIFVLTFDPHPRRYFQPERALFQLTDRDMQKMRLAEAGFDGRITLIFNEGLAKMQAKTFIEDILVARLAAHTIVVGEDFHFGHGRAGTPDFLIQEGNRLGFDVILASSLRDGDGTIISSSAIREALRLGDVPRANAMLGYSYTIAANVIHGEKRGRELGYPTANLQLPPENGLKHGIYAVFARIEGVMHQGVASFGRRPTFDNGAPLLEVHVFDFSGDLYGKKLEISFIAFLRGEEKFASLDDLIRQMDADSRLAKQKLAEAEIMASHA